MSSPNIAIIWDFDETLTQHCSTTKTVEFFSGTDQGKVFWDTVKDLKGVERKKECANVLGTDAPIWMAALARLAYQQNMPLNKEFFRKFIAPSIEMFPQVSEFLERTKAISLRPEFKTLGLEVHHFVVSAGLKDLIRQCIPDELLTWVFACKYKVIKDEHNRSLSIPVYCMDETVKTRALFEISKGCFPKDKGESPSVNDRIDSSKLWAPFENIIYVGDSYTDVPAFALVRERGGMGVMVYNPHNEKTKILNKMRTDKRVDAILPADFSKGSALSSFVEARCTQIRQRYEAQTPVKP